MKAMEQIGRYEFETNS